MCVRVCARTCVCVCACSCMHTCVPVHVCLHVGVSVRVLACLCFMCMCDPCDLGRLLVPGSRGCSLPGWNLPNTWLLGGLVCFFPVTLSAT